MSQLVNPGDAVITVLGTPLITAVTLPAGSVHALSAAMAADVDEPGHLLWQYAAAAAASRGRPVLVRIGRPTGHVDSYAVTSSGSRNPHHLAPPTNTAPGGVPDPRWSEQLPDTDGLLQAAFAAEGAGDFEAALHAAGRLAARLEEDLGHDHPYPWLATELQADLALLSGRWDRAIDLYTRVATARYSLRSAEVTALRCLRLAVLSWLRTSDQPTTGPAGLTLAHTLITYLPYRPDVLRAVLRRLPGHLLPAPPPGTTTTFHTPH